MMCSQSTTTYPASSKNDEQTPSANVNNNTRKTAEQEQEQLHQRMPTPTWAPLLKYISGIEVRHLVTPDEVIEAKKCLYKIYHVEQGWNPGPNPSGVRVVEDRLEDDLIVDWFGIFREDKLVGVGRFMGDLETVRYISKEAADQLMTSINNNQKGQLRVCEINRTALVPEVRGGVAAFCLWVAGTYYAGVRGYDVSVGVVNPKLARVFQERYGFRRTGLRMKYSKSDPSETEICFSRVGSIGLLYQLTMYAAWIAGRILLGKRSNKSGASKMTRIWYGE